MILMGSFVYGKQNCSRDIVRSVGTNDPSNHSATMTTITADVT